MTRTSRTGANRGDVGPEDERTGTMPAGRTTSSTDGDERREGVGPVSGRRMRCRVVALAVLGLATMVVGLLTAAPASAHAQLLGSDPKADSTVGAPLTEITLLFNDLVRGDYSTVVLTGPDGRRHGAGQPRAVDKRVHLPISPLRSGGYRVAYRVVSADGHPIEGQFRFTVALAPGQEPTRRRPRPPHRHPRPPQRRAPPGRPAPLPHCGGPAPSSSAPRWSRPGLPWYADSAADRSAEYRSARPGRSLAEALRLLIRAARRDRHLWVSRIMSTSQEPGVCLA